MMKVRDLRGYKAFKAMQVFHTLMLGLKMLPSYRSESYEEFFARIELMAAADQEKMIREAALFVEVGSEELDALVCFAEDPNGVAYGPQNISNLTPAQIYEIVVSVCVEISKIKIDFVTSAEKKN